MSLKIAFIMDPMEGILVDKDTTFVFMLEAQSRGHEIHHVDAREMFVQSDRPHARCRRVKVLRAREHYEWLGEQERSLDSFDVVFMRKDPPFDIDYLFATQLLSLIDPEKTFVLNSPSGLREANEKLYALNFPSLIPSTLVSREPVRLKGFLSTLGGEMIIKPLDGAGGAGVFHVQASDRNLNALLEMATENGTRLIMAQRYLSEARNGDKRLIMLDGVPLGATLRVPTAEETRANIHVGGTCVHARLTERDREICDVLAPRLKADGLHFVGLDIIGNWLTEINVTSPTGVQEINALDGVKLESAVIDFVERRAPSRK